MNSEKIETYIPESDESEGEVVLSEKGVEIEAGGKIKNTDQRPLDKISEGIIHDYYKRKGFEVLEITDTQIKLISADGKKMTFPTDAALGAATHAEIDIKSL